LPRRIVELLGIVANVFVIQKPLNCRRPEQRSKTHLCGPLANHRNNIGRVLRRRGESCVFETINTGLQSTTNLFRTMRMSDNWKLPLVCFVDDCQHFFHRHLILID
jgi:hypothetical protein